MVPASGNLAGARATVLAGSGPGWHRGQPLGRRHRRALARRRQRLKSLASRLSAEDLHRLLADGGRRAGPPPIPSFLNTGPGLHHLGPVEAERLVNAVGCISVAGRSVPIGTPLAGRRITLRLDGTLLQFIEEGILLRSLPFPLTSAEGSVACVEPAVAVLDKPAEAVRLTGRGPADRTRPG